MTLIGLQVSSGLWIVVRISSYLFIISLRLCNCKYFYRRVRTLFIEVWSSNQSIPVLDIVFRFKEVILEFGILNSPKFITYDGLDTLPKTRKCIPQYQDLTYCVTPMFYPRKPKHLQNIPNKNLSVYTSRLLDNQAKVLVAGWSWGSMVRTSLTGITGRIGWLGLPITVVPTRINSGGKHLARSEIF